MEENFGKNYGDVFWMEGDDAFFFQAAVMGNKGDKALRAATIPVLLHTHPLEVAGKSRKVRGLRKFWHIDMVNTFNAPITAT